MKKHKLLILVAAAGLLGGCAATLTPTGEIYTEALLPVDTTVVVESYPLVAYGPRPHYRPAPPRGGLRPGPRYHPPVHYGTPGQHRAPGVFGPRTPHRQGSFHNTRPGPQGAFHPNRPGAQGPQVRGGQQPKPGGLGGRPQGSRGPQQNTRSPHARGPR